MYISVQMTMECHLCPLELELQKALNLRVGEANWGALEEQHFLPTKPPPLTQSSNF